VSAARKRWECPAGQHPAVLAPQRLRRKDIRRYCLPCSMSSGLLVERVLPTLEKKRTERAARGREQRKAATAVVRAKRDEQLERFARYCGPAAIAKVLGVKRLTAAKKLAERVGLPATGVHVSDMFAVLHYNGIRARTERVPRDQRVTLAQWRRAHRGATAILAAGHHFHVLKSGRLVEANGTKKSRALVTDVIWIEGKPKPAAEPPKFRLVRGGLEAL
jgi:hypothetical protein